MNTFKNILYGTIFGLFILAILDYASGIPDVHMSYTTDQCVKVLNYPTTIWGVSEYSCDNMPGKFNHVWVK